MNHFFEKHWFGWGLAAILALLLTVSVAAGQGAIKPVNNWMERGPQEVLRENFGSVVPGPTLEPGSHMVWVAAKENSLSPYSTWRSFGPFDVALGQRYLVTVAMNHAPVAFWRVANAHPNNAKESSEPASVFYLNQNDGDQILGVLVVPVSGPVPNVVITGTLTPLDLLEPRYPSGHHVHPLMLDKGTTYIIEMLSSDFDTYLMVEDNAGALLAQNDEGTILTNQALNSRVVFRPTTTDTYRLVATAFSPEGAGNYMITVREVPVMMRLEDRLTPSDEARNDCHVKTYDVALTAARRYYIDLESSEFGTCVKLLNPDGMIVAFDEGGMVRDTRITFEARATGNYRIVATSSEERALGAFTLTVREEE